MGMYVHSGISTLVEKNSKAVRKVLVFLWTLSVLVFIADMITFIPGTGMIKTLAFTATAFVSALSGLSPKVFDTREEYDVSDDFFEEQDFGYSYSFMDKLLSLCLGVGLCTLFIGTLFKIMHWPGAGVMVLFGGGVSALTSVICLTSNKIKKFATASLFTTVLFIGLTFTGIHESVKYRDYPDYVEAINTYRENPNSIVAEAKLEYEATKMQRKRMNQDMPEAITEAYEEFLADTTRINLYNFENACQRY